MAGKSAKPKPPKDDELTPRQIAFAIAYARLGVGEHAAIEAGYSPSCARMQASRLLTKDNIRKYVLSITDATKSSAIADVAELRERLTTILRGDDPKFDAKDCLRAIELLGKSNGMFAEKAPDGASAASREELLQAIAERLPD